MAVLYFEDLVLDMVTADLTEPSQVARQVIQEKPCYPALDFGAEEEVLRAAARSACFLQVGLTSSA